MKQVKGGVTAAKGFEAASTAAGIKYKDRTDMALVYSQVPCVAAGTFTTNVVKAAPVKWDQQVVKSGAKAQAVVVNSGIANACTGRQGLDCCEAEAKCAGELLGVPTDAVLVASTGVIDCVVCCTFPSSSGFIMILPCHQCGVFLLHRFTQTP